MDFLLNKHKTNIIPSNTNFSEKELQTSKTQQRNSTFLFNCNKGISPILQPKKYNPNIVRFNFNDKILIKNQTSLKESRFRPTSDQNLLKLPRKTIGMFNYYKRRIALVQPSNSTLGNDVSEITKNSANNSINNNVFQFHQMTSQKDISIIKSPRMIDKLKVFYNKCLTKTLYKCFTLILVLLSLFLQDIKILVCSYEEDGYLDGLTYILIMIMFIRFFADIILNPLYFWSLECLFDFISTMGMIFENERVFSKFNLLKIKIDNVRTPFTNSDSVEMYIRAMKAIKLALILKIYNLSNDILQIFEDNKKKRKNEIKKQKKIEKKKKIEERKKANKLSIHPFFQHSNNLLITHNSNNLTNSKTNLKEISSDSLKHLNKGTQTMSIKIEIPNKKPEELISDNEQISLDPSSIDKEKKIYEENKDKRINKLLLNGINNKIIIIILILCFLSIFTEDNFYHNTNGNTYGTISQIIDLFFDEGYTEEMDDFSRLNKTFSNYIMNMSERFYPIINISRYDNGKGEYYLLYQNASLRRKSYRIQEIGYSLEKINGTLVSISLVKKIKARSILLICRTIYIYLLILFLTRTLRSISKTLVLNPIEDMIKIVDLVAQDPVNCKTIEELKKNCQKAIENSKSKIKSTNYEIKIIQYAIIRISALMAIGFGEAGGEILKENIQSSEGLNPMLEGKKVNAIFGFCYIRHFPEINEALQEKTIIFVNQISEIVHSAVDKFGGITNKNIGDCYLLVWKFKDDSIVMNSHRNGLDLFNPSLGNLVLKNSSFRPMTVEEEERKSYISDCALLAFLSIIKKINKNQTILSYRNNIALKNKLGPTFKVQMGFGLHLGWGIEGAIGSYYKIDCSYLSPNVNISARLETATNIYGVDILFSGEFYDSLSTFMKKLCRKIDVVALKGCVTPVTLYTVDVNPNIKPGKIKKNKKKMNIRERRIKKMKLKNIYEIQTEKTIGQIYLSRSRGLRHLLKGSKSETFLSYFDEGYMYYINGDWKEAYTELKNALFLDQNDGPTRTLLRYIKKYNKIAPSDWDGFRKLEAKF